jgi:DNA-binding transcriptional MerR regulator/quercetin dioxygenase-like cupin family protein
MTRARAAPETKPAAAGYRIGAAARMVGMSPSSLRLWERQGLLKPHRARNGYRLYTADDLEQLRRVRQMRHQRVNAPGIRRLMPVPPRAERGSLPAGGGPPVPDGARLRALRRERGMSLRDASRRSGLSVSFLSSVERGVAGASVTALTRLTQAYGVTMLDLFAPGAGAGRRVRPDERPVLELEGAGVRIEQLARGTSSLEPQLFVLAPGSSSEGAYAHAGDEFVFVLDGGVTFWVGSGERYRLQAGDSLSFPSTLPHRWRNRADGESRLLWINTPPTF